MMAMRLRGLLLFLTTACLTWAAVIDGTWSAQVQMPPNKKSGAAARMVECKFDLKADGNKPTGTVTLAGKKRSVTAQIVDGKIDGNQFSFTTVQTTKKGEERLDWQGTINGDTMQGTRVREGRKRGQSFTAKRG